MSTVFPDPATPFGERVACRLREDRLIWLTTVGVGGTPQPNPVWFLWDGETFLVYNRTDAKRLAHLRANPKVALNFDGDGQGGDIVVITGEVRFSPEDPPADQLPEYVEKYRDFIARLFGTPVRFASEYTVPIRITPLAVRGH
jgi:PPOX class probable F420-dependent enzyme